VTVKVVDKKRVRDEKGRFMDGVLGPGRKPKTQEQRDADAILRARSPEAAEIMLSMITNPNTPPGVVADLCKYVIDRAHGKAETIGKLQLEHTGEPSMQVQIRSILLEQQRLLIEAEASVGREASRA